jgi:hypothetical protein
MPPPRGNDLVTGVPKCLNELEHVSFAAAQSMRRTNLQNAHCEIGNRIGARIG